MAGLPSTLVCVAAAGKLAGEAGYARAGLGQATCAASLIPSSFVAAAPAAALSDSVARKPCVVGVTELSRRREVSSCAVLRNAKHQALSLAHVQPIRGSRQGSRVGCHAGIERGNHGSEGEGEDEVVKREKEREEELLRALNLDPEIPEDSSAFLAKVSSRAYEMRRRLEQTMSANSYDVVEANPWRETHKEVYVLAKEDEQLYTMRTRRPRTEVEKELDLLFFRGRRLQRVSSSSSPSSSSSAASSNSPSAIAERPTRHARGGPDASRLGSSGAQQTRNAVGGVTSNSSKNSRGSAAAAAAAFRVQVEDIREGILVFEDEEVAAQYCTALDDGSGSECVGVAQFEASELFKVCQMSKALAVVFRKGSTPPSPEYLRHTLKARRLSLEDSDF